MTKYRKYFDPILQRNKTIFYTLAGTGTEDVSGIFNNTGKNFMNYFEANDDAVTVSCAVIPNGIHLATLPYYHDQMINNNRTWKILHSLFLNGYMNGAIISIN